MAQDVTIIGLDGEHKEITLKYQLKKTCHECPYSGKTKGWIGEHESAQDFHDIAKQDIPFPCHMSTRQSCVGNAIYMNRLCKSSRDQDKAEFQQRIRATNTEDVLFSWTGEALVAHHGK